MSSEAVEPIDVAPVSLCITRVPLRTHTLPPATRTNSYLLQGRTKRWIVDAGTDDPEELAKLDAAIALVGPVSGLLLTHHHPDHVQGAAAVATRHGVPVYASTETWTQLGALRGIACEHVERTTALLADGIEPIPTPGHARGHLAFAAPDGHVACGDLISGLGTIVIDPPDGDMRAYLDSLEAMRSRGPAGLHPSHGPSPRSADACLAAYVAHRLARERRVLLALRSTPEPLAVVTARAYADTPVALHGFAARSALAHLEKLAWEGRAVGSDGWCRGPRWSS